MTLLGRTLDKLDRILRVLRRIDTGLSLLVPPYIETWDLLDRRAGERIRGLQTPGGVQVAKAATQAGSWPTHVGVMVDGAAQARIRGDRTIALTTIVSMAGCSGIYTVVKAGLGRERPDPDGHRVRVRDASFPSGHAATAAAAARTLAELHDLPKLPLFALAAGVAFSRIYLGVHHPSDAIAGLVLGWSWASAVSAVGSRFARDRDLLPDSPRGAGTGRDTPDAPLEPHTLPGPSADQLRARRKARASGHPVSDEDPD